MLRFGRAAWRLLFEMLWFGRGGLFRCIALLAAVGSGRICGIYAAIRFRLVHRCVRRNGPCIVGCVGRLAGRTGMGRLGSVHGFVRMIFLFVQRISLLSLRAVLVYDEGNIYTGVRV